MHRLTRLLPRLPQGETFTFISPAGLPPKDSRACCTPWSVFQDRTNGATFCQPPDAVAPFPPSRRHMRPSTACSPASRDWTSEKGASLERPASSRLRVIVTSVADFRRRGATRSSLLRGGGSLPPQPLVDTDHCRWQEPRRSADVR